VVQFATVRASVNQTLTNLPVPPRAMLTQIGLAVTERPPFSLAAVLDPASIAPGKAGTLRLTVNRGPGFTAEIALTATGLPANVTAVLKSIPAGQSEVKVPVNAAANAALGTFDVTIVGKALHQNREHTASAAAKLVIKK
jgi:hypothetical protein